MVSTRILDDHRAARAAAAHRRAADHAPRRRRRAQTARPHAQALLARVRAIPNLGMFAGVAALVVVLVAYLGLSAQVTAASYELARLQNQQSQLQADQAQLRLAEVSLRTPAQVEHDAQQAGLQRTPPSAYEGYQASAIALATPVGDQPADATPGWQRALAAVAGTVSGNRDVLASDR